MKAVLHENNLDCYEKVFQQRKTIELNGETVVPDKMPDIGLLGESFAQAVLRVKRTENGIGVLEGELLSTVCFLPDGENGCRNLEQQLPWHVEFESDRIKDTCSSIGEIRVVQMETRMLNPRKILVKVQLSVLFTVYEKRKAVICDNVEECSAVQVQTETFEYNVVGTVCEKTFVATDEYPVPAHLIDSRVLCKSVQLRVDDVKSLTNKLIIKGSVLSNVVMVTQQGEAEQLSFTSSFSLIAETDCENVSAEIEAVLMPNALYYEVTSDGKILSVEVHGVCQILAYAKQKISYISDAYSNFYELRTEKTTLGVSHDNKINAQREQLTITIPGHSRISKVCFSSANILEWKQGERNTRIPLCASACVQYENGTRDWLKKQMSAELKVKEFEKVIDVRVTDLYCVENGNEAELRITLEAEVKEERESVLHMISSIETDEEQPYCQVRPSLSVVRNGGVLWELAKEFGSTVELIRRYNGLEENEVEADGLLLIPKQMM